ncbi:MAG: UbiA family prenyltransferase [Pedosphaera sp.]|nr:UbiA family prenyltransferase [Pedosphaera sp.]
MPPTVVNAKESSVPLCVDLDGTLIKTDVLWESMILLLKERPLYLLMLPFWLLRGRAHMKQRIASLTDLNPGTLPYHQPFLEYLRVEKRKGRRIILATAADQRLAERVAQHLGLFSEVVASNGQTNMRGKNKGHALSERFGKKQFDYAGNSTVDLPVWEMSRNAIVVNANDRLADRARGLTEVSHVFNEPGSFLRALAKSMRPHQWVKNVIIFVPLLTSHEFSKLKPLSDAMLAFIAFSLCASGVYMLNDLLDLDSDRHHATKKMRPFASGELHLPVGLVMAPVLLALSLGVAIFLSWKFVAVLAGYFLITTSYSWKLKQVALLDVFFLAGLYTIRLVAGHAATGIPYSFWLLAFSMFIFLSLALVKRFTELKLLRLQNKSNSRGRDYAADDLELVAMLGIASGFMSILVMALYVNSPEVRDLYKYPTLLLLVCPLLLYWISRVWLIAHRGRMHEDPIVFALKDGVSYLVGALTLCVVWLATGHH